MLYGTYLSRGEEEERSELKKKKHWIKSWGMYHVPQLASMLAADSSQVFQSTSASKSICWDSTPPEATLSWKFECNCGSPSAHAHGEKLGYAFVAWPVDQSTGIDGFAGFAGFAAFHWRASPPCAGRPLDCCHPAGTGAKLEGEGFVTGALPGMDHVSYGPYMVPVGALGGAGPVDVPDTEPVGG
jgi:hypothetical protein